jgi:hypothetical protein
VSIPNRQPRTTGSLCYNTYQTSIRVGKFMISIPPIHEFD